MHFIQSYILDKLVYAHNLRNRDMRPPNIESNLYQYHLLQLQKEGYVQKLENGYALTGRGLAYADRHSTTLKKTRSQPKLITVIFLSNSNNELLLVPKKRQPFMDTYNLPSGKIHLDETISDAARRELKEKVDSTCDSAELHHFGVAHYTIRQDNFVISDYIALLMKAQTNNIQIPEGAAFYKLDIINTLPLHPSVSELVGAYINQNQFSEAVIEI